MSFAALVVVTALLTPLSHGDAKAKSPKVEKAEPKKEAVTAEIKTEPPPAGTIQGPGPNDDARKVAEQYLNALAGKGKEDARNFLLGDLTLTAQDFRIPNWRIASRDEARVEERPTLEAMHSMWSLDKVGAESLNTVMVAEGDNLKLTQEDAQKLLGPTRAAAAKFQEAFPLFAYVSRVDKDLFWHPDNPWRKEAKKLGKEGSYKLELHRFFIEEKEKGKATRVWPLRVLRVKTKTYDSGWKILPASDWDPKS